MVTIKDVAKLAGVSPSTASRVLHDSDLISHSTKNKVLKAVKELDYSPNFAAQNLASKMVNTIGVILPVSQEGQDNDLFHMQIVQGIVRMCASHAYTVSLATGETTSELITNVKTLIQQGQIKRFIFVYSCADDPVLAFIKEQDDIKYVVVGNPYDSYDERLYSVDNNNEQTSIDATEFLHSKGYQEIGFVYANLEDMVQRQRYHGYKETAKELGFPCMTLKMQRDNHEKNCQNFKKFIKMYPHCRAFVVIDDLMGIRLQQVMDILGIPSKKYAIISFDNSVLAEVARPQLTSVELFPHFLGVEAAALAMSLNQKKQKYQMVRNCIVPHKIIERKSTPNLAN